AMQTCVRNLSLFDEHHAPELVRGDILKAIHDRLEHVLVERMDPSQIVQRFNRTYTVFYIPRDFMLFVENAKNFIDTLENVNGLIVFDRTGGVLEESVGFLAGFDATWGFDILTPDGNRIFRSLDCSVPRRSPV
nr:hypothetical protein [Candidatus Sigynarchaeota archaeon]